MNFIPSLERNFVRMLVIGAAFLTVTLGLILLQPGTEQKGAAETPAAPLLAQNSEEDEALSMILEETVTRSNTSLTEALPSEGDALEASTAQVLAALQTPSAANQPQAPDHANDMRALTSNIVASLGGVTPEITDDMETVERLVVQALRQGQSDAYIDALLNEAAAVGGIEVPSAMKTSAGRVDTPTLIAALVSKSIPAEQRPVVKPVAQADGVEVRAVKRDGATVQQNVYTVQRGDSLGAIAQRIYGDAGLFGAIFDANRSLISSPDQIRVGQRLTIPDLI